MLMKHSFISAICALMIGMPLFAQSPVKGRVTDKGGVTLPGVMILDKTSGKWAVSDVNGEFRLDEASKGDALEISCMGFATTNLVYQGEASLNVTMTDDALELEESVVIGYGSVKKKDLTGAVGVIDSKVLESQSTTQLSQSLQGSVPGLAVTRSSSMPGASASVQVRGVTSINGSSPLILVDGMAVSSIDEVSNDDVEQITVLKDAASASIYGARAAAGVILITTKNAKEGDLHINYNAEYTLNTATTWAEYLNDPVNYMTMFNEYKWNDAGNGEGGDYQTYPKDYIENYLANSAVDPVEYPNYDWKKALIHKTSGRQKHNLSLAYGNDAIKTRISATYENNDALYDHSNYERMMARVRNTIKLNKRLSADADFSVKYSIKNDPTSNPISAANMYPSVYLGEYPDGRIAPGKAGSNMLAILREGGYNKNQQAYLTGKLALSYKLLDNLDITASFTPTYTITKQKIFNKAVPYYDYNDAAVVLGYVVNHQTTDLTEKRNDAYSFEFQTVANYETRIADAHNINLMAGYEQYSYTHEALSVVTNGMAISSFPYMDLANKDNLATGGDAYQNAYRSFFGRLMYNYLSRYYVQANIRTDGSSRFAKKYRWGVFPSVSLGWVVSNEKFMQNIESLTYLKLRASLGTLGNERIGNYPYQSSVNFHKSVMFDGTGSNVTSQMAAAQEAAAVEDITWETTWTYDLGADASFLDNRLAFSGDYFYKETKDMLLDVQIPAFTGFESPTVNAGTMHTNGWEIKVDWHDKVGDFTYGVGFNLSDSKSVMGDLKGTTFFGDKIIREGEEYNSWYGYRCNGIVLTDEQLANGAKQLISTLGPGDLQYKDISGTDGAADGKISADYDKVILGSSLPHFLYGGYINVGWKGFSLSVLMNGVGKKKSLLSESMVRPFVSQWLSAPAVLLNSDGSRNYWSVYNTDEQNAAARYPRLCYTSAEKNNYQMSDYWLIDGSYFRVKNINLGYTVPSSVIKKYGIKGLRMYLNIEDPICINNYLKGWDPEQSTGSYISRAYTVGFDIKF